MTTRVDIANLIFPEVQETIQDLEKKYPPRKEGIVTVSYTHLDVYKRQISIKINLVIFILV